MATHNTVGGAAPDLGNLIQGFGEQPRNGVPVFSAGIAIDAGSDNVIEHNTFLSNVGEGAVAIPNDAICVGVRVNIGNQIIENSMRGNSLGINLGGGPFRPNREHA